MRCKSAALLLRWSIDPHYLMIPDVRLGIGDFFTQKILDQTVRPFAWFRFE